VIELPARRWIDVEERNLSVTEELEAAHDEASADAAAAGRSGS
jgi:hypothetical protein